MELSFALPVSGSWATPERQLLVAERAEALGYRGLWTFQRLMYSGPPEDPFVPVEGGRWPEYYHSVLDPLLPLAFVAARTSAIRLGVAVLNGVFYSPVLLGKLLTSLDVLSGGRLDAGIGLGWSRSEYAASGVEMARRGARLDEMLECLSVLLGDDPVEFAGNFYQVPRSDFLPKAVQRPRMPLLVGGSSDAALRRAVRHADGWISSSTADVTTIARSVGRLRELASEQGKDPSSVRAVTRGVVRLRGDGWSSPQRRALEGPLEAVAADIHRFAEAGVDELFLDPNFDVEVGNPGADPEASTEDALRLLEAVAPRGSGPV
ncbi:MAG: TIGR03619 family F420-dependent LLM class oxidoreductase [Acidimicrobiales bacterium]